MRLFYFILTIAFSFFFLSGCLEVGTTTFNSLRDPRLIFAKPLYNWEVSAWGQCSATSCETLGTQERTTVCKKNGLLAVADSFCNETKPAIFQSCSVPTCNTPAKPPLSGLISFILDKRIINIPSSGTYPLKGVSLVDPVTGFKVTRIADKSELTGDYGGSLPSMSLIVYARYTPSNTTGEFVIVHGTNSASAWVYRTRDNQMTTILRFKPSMGSASRSLGEVNELRWDYSGQYPYRLYFVGRSLKNSGQNLAGENTGMSFYYTDIDPATGQQSTPVLIRDFSANFPNAVNAEIMNDVEGDSSYDSRYWAWQLMDTSRGNGYLPYGVFTYDKTSNSILGSIQRNCAGAAVPCVAIDTPATSAPYISRPNMVEMSPLGTRVIVDWGRSYSGSRDADLGSVADGPKGFLPNFSDPIRVGADEAHSGWAWGANGEEMFVSQNNRNDFIEAVDIKNSTTANCSAISGNSYTCGVKVVSYQDLDQSNWTLGMHFGRVYDQAKRGWLFMNTYDSGYSTWGKNQNLFIQIKPYNSVTVPKIMRFGSSFNDHYDYRSEGSGALDFRGNKIWSTANWGFLDGRGDAISLELPSDWFTQLNSLP